MKRKKKLRTIIIDGDHHDRPMIDLPDDHWFVKAQNAMCSKWININDDCQMVFILDHRKCIAELEKLSPDILKLAKQCTKDASFIQEFQLANGDFMILHAMWSRPDGDDPNRLESGWLISGVKGNQKYRDKYMRLTELCRHHNFDQGTVVNYPSK
jgi:hypothetical protein